MPFWRTNVFLPYRRQKDWTGRGGVARRWLHRLGPSWLASPWRRLVQTGCLLLFGYLFLWVSWPYAEVFGASHLADRETVPVETFLWLDPLVGLSTALAARHWSLALTGGAAILLVCLVWPRGFCGWLCPLGTLIDLFDSLVGRRLRRWRVNRDGGWVNLKYYLLAAVLLAAVGGTLLSGWVAAIPVLTRGAQLTVGQLQLGLGKGWYQVSPPTAATILSVILFAGVFALGLLRPRFWCRYVCPTGALFSVFNLCRQAERRVSPACIDCGKCVEICPFDAIREDFLTRTADCTFCQSCGGVCPTGAIDFVSLARATEQKPPDPAVAPRSLSRRAFCGAGLTGMAAVAAKGLATDRPRPLRPPGSVPEEVFAELCIRCGQCFQVCPGPVLHPAGLAEGLNNLWTPIAVPTKAGCHQECNFCGQVCPTGAIRPLDLAVKRRTKMGLAVINPQTCLPHVGEQDCQLCVDECVAAGYDAIELRWIDLPVGEIPEGIFDALTLAEIARIQAPVVDVERCVGCGLCEFRCETTYVRQQGLLSRSAIVVTPEGDDRRFGPT